ncbi:heavy metal translocating P-type ATPase [Rhodohalobacter sp. 8-1]|uniref:heavy metal translocating P-type ATPase n=1 Tax=Rhodohalobacter sp. 8-1 TaxID=3131972 RepID=UPI0030ED2FFC
MSENVTDEACCDSCGSCSPQKTSESSSYLTEYWAPILSGLLLLGGLSIEHLLQAGWFSGPAKLIWYLVAYMPVGLPVLQQGLKNALNGSLFTEFFLMGIATVGAFFIGEYAEGVAVMLFYSVGELFQQRAVQKARANIRSLLDVRPETAHLLRDGQVTTVHPKSISVGEQIRVRPGERVPLDGELISEGGGFDTSALTGESTPRYFSEGETVLSGMVNQNQVVELEVTKSYENSSISRILQLVEDASSRKAETELFIRRFAKIYTPAVVGLAALLVALPAIFVTPYVFDEWLYRGLVFLVISCPCALMISIPLGYFGGIGASSKNGILVKGSNFLDALTSVKTVVFDKTGTLTEGRYSVQDIDFISNNQDQMISLLNAVETSSTHPVAKAITEHIGKETILQPKVTDQQELPGFGVKAIADGKPVIIGSEKLMRRENIDLNGHAKNGRSDRSVVYFAVDGKHAGTITLSDRLKADAADAIKQLKKLGVERTIMLSGDRKSIADEVGKDIGIDEVFGDLLPDEKANKLDKIKQRYPGVTAYAGDGINDAPVLALSDVGIAMGAMGSDVAIETADVVIQTDQPSKIATSIRISKATRTIVWQNIGLALGVKALVLLLGAAGMATLWEAVFADVGVTLLAVLNAVRIQKMDFD